MVLTLSPPLSISKQTENPQAAAALALIKAADALVAADDREHALWSYREAFSIYETLATAAPRNVLWRHRLRSA